MGTWGNGTRTIGMRVAHGRGDGLKRFVTKNGIPVYNRAHYRRKFETTLQDRDASLDSSIEEVSDNVQSVLGEVAE